MLSGQSTALGHIHHRQQVLSTAGQRGCLFISRSLTVAAVAEIF